MLLNFTIICRLSRVESELVLTEQKSKDFEILLEKERSDKEALSSSYRSELRSAQEVSIRITQRKHCYHMHIMSYIVLSLHITATFLLNICSWTISNTMFFIALTGIIVDIELRVVLSFSELSFF